MTDTSDALIDALDDLLETERRAVMEGDLDRFAQILEEKVALIDRLNAIEAPSPDELGTVRDKIKRNQDLLESSLKGIRSVADRMAELRRIQQNMSTYDRSGKRRQISSPRGGQLEKRA